MRLLLDTNILISLTPRRAEGLSERIFAAIRSAENQCFASVASLWEVTIKARLNKLQLGLSPSDFAGYLDAIGVTLLPISRDHVLTELEVEPNTRDPFDRLLLATCQAEGLRLVTLDRALMRHELALRPE